MGAWHWVLVGCAAVGCAGPSRVSPASEPAVEKRLRSVPPTPLEVRVAKGSTETGVQVDELTFRGAVAGAPPLTATRVRPAGQAPRAAILWVHWLGEPATTNRTEFLAEAVELARHGAVSLLVDAMWSAPKWYDRRVPEQDFDASLGQAQDLIRALDLLAAEPGVDPARIGFVGHDYGAMHGVLAGATERRPRAWVLIAATPRFSDWAFYGPKPEDREAYLARMATLDPVVFIGRLNGAVLLQFASRDEYIPKDAADALAAAAPAGTTVRTYDADHAVDVAPARAERRVFLETSLGLR